MADFHVTGDKGKTPLVEEMEECIPSRSVSPTDMELERVVEMFQASNLGYTDEITAAHLAASNQSLSSPSIPGTEKVSLLLEQPQPEALAALAIDAVVDNNRDVTSRTRRRRRAGGSEPPAPKMTRSGYSGVDASGGSGVSPQEMEARPLKTRKNKTAQKKKHLAESSDSVVRNAAVGDGTPKHHVTKARPALKPATEKSKIKRHVTKARPIPKTADNPGTAAPVIYPGTPSPMIDVDPIPKTDLGSVDGPVTPQSQPALVSNARWI